MELIKAYLGVIRLKWQLYLDCLSVEASRTARFLQGCAMGTSNLKSDVFFTATFTNSSTTFEFKILHSALKTEIATYLPQRYLPLPYIKRK